MVRGAAAAAVAAGSAATTGAQCQPFASCSGLSWCSCFLGTACPATHQLKQELGAGGPATAAVGLMFLFVSAVLPHFVTAIKGFGR